MTTPPSPRNDEPILTTKDRVKWRTWKRACLQWAESSTFQKRLENAEYHIHRMDEQCPDAYVGWSAGKDSTVLTHLVLVECGCGSHAMSLKDDLDYPGELKYVESLAGEWGIDLDVLTPDEPLLPRLREMNLHYKDDLHSRRSEFSQVFYRLVKQ